MHKDFLTDIKKTQVVLLLFYLLAALTVLPAFNHSHGHAYSNSYQAINSVTGNAHAHPDNLLSGDLFNQGNDYTHLLEHSKDNNQHSHSLKKLSQISSRRSSSIGKHAPLLLHIVCNKVAFQKISFEIFHQKRPPIHNYNLEYIIVATNLPPPTV